ncbi:unnamed protein product [Rotaria sp. Silwood2]|nr:unnamed protein product [Rotaria sp. Silwood2]CAF2750707.1 unnamed protein product [Rotaria sp. Silwood2]CAF3183931.1 unnamed protein product [Rotaria sp. Silwood2]CAF3923425.1 unnamed protein product [Rotaria sp. Silwood2]CAF4002027.1 unnamed protein product [Rotaria sp. Silwood2]
MSNLSNRSPYHVSFSDDQQHRTMSVNLDDPSAGSTQVLEKVTNSNATIEHEKIPLQIEPDVSIKFNESIFEEHDHGPRTVLDQLYDYTGGIVPNAIEAEKQTAVRQNSANLGTIFGVYLPCVQNIIGVIVFIRLFWLIGIAGVLQTLLIVIICSSCTLLTAISMAAIATNGIVPAGGAYFMISRSLGPEFGGAVGILFYLGNTFAASMYIVGAIEIVVKYMCPDKCRLFGDDVEIPFVAFNHYRIYGTLLLLIIGACVLIGIKFVTKIAPLSLLAVLISLLCIYAGVIKSSFNPPDLPICLVGSNPSHLIKSSVLHNDVMTYCRPDKWCYVGNKTILCPLYVSICNKSTNVLCSKNNSIKNVRIEQGIPGLKHWQLSENLVSHYRGVGEVEHDIKGDSTFEVVAQEITTFLILVGIYFPSVTGIMAGSNRSGDLRDPSQSIPRGTIAAILTTSTIYLSNVIFLGACTHSSLLRDKFGDSINKQLVVAALAWPSKWVIMIGAFCSTVGAGLQTLTGAPRLLQAVAKDDLIPILGPLAKSYRGEPVPALFLTLLICECGILIADLDKLTALLSMFFLLCYGFVNLACALQTILRAPSWRPRFRFYHWILSLMGVLLSISIMFMASWYFALIAMIIAIVIYKFIEYKGAEKEWGDGIRGLSMSAARYALYRVDEAPPHTKNWRPQLLAFINVQRNEEDESYVLRHPRLLNFLYQLKAGQGFVVAASILEGDYLDKYQYIEPVRSVTLAKVQGFAEVLVAKDAEDGISALIQTEGLGGLKPNTIVLCWPLHWKKDYESYTADAFIRTIAVAEARRCAVIVPKNINSFPDNKEIQEGTIDIWWIIHDGGLLFLIAFLLKRHKVWSRCRLRLFTVAQLEDNSVEMKKDLEQYMYQLRIEAEVDVVEMENQEISAYAYERTLKLAERVKLLKDLKLPDKELQLQPQILMESLLNSQRQQSIDESDDQYHYTFTPNQLENLKKSVSESSMRKMHSAVRLNQKIRDRSSDAKLVLINLPSPPSKQTSLAAYSYMEYVDVLTEGLDRLLLMRGSGREVITIFS